MITFPQSAKSADGGFAAAGYSRSIDGDFTVFNHGGYDAVVVKFDTGGGRQWVKNISVSSNNIFTSIIQTSDGGFTAAGYSNSADGDFVGLNHDSYDAFAVKFDGSGDIQWVKDIGGSNNETFNSITQTADGAFITAGYDSSIGGDFTGLSKGIDDAIIVRFSTVSYAPSSLTVTPGDGQGLGKLLRVLQWRQPHHSLRRHCDALRRRAGDHSYWNA